MGWTSEFVALDTKPVHGTLRLILMNDLGQKANLNQSSINIAASKIISFSCDGYVGASCGDGAY